MICIDWDEEEASIFSICSTDEIIYPIKKENFPLRLISSEIPLGINYKAGVSAQLKSAAILAGLNSYGQTFIEEKIKSRDHTENMLKANKNLYNVKQAMGHTSIKTTERYMHVLDEDVRSDINNTEDLEI